MVKPDQLQFSVFIVISLVLFFVEIGFHCKFSLKYIFFWRSGKLLIIYKMWKLRDKWTMKKFWNFNFFQKFFSIFWFIMCSWSVWEERTYVISSDLLVIIKESFHISYLGYYYYWFPILKNRWVIKKNVNLNVNMTLIRPLKWKFILCVTPHVAAA